MLLFQKTFFIIKVTRVSTFACDKAQNTYKMKIEGKQYRKQKRKQVNIKKKFITFALAAVVIAVEFVG